MVEDNRRQDDAALREIASEAADAALEKFFLTMGVDISTPEGVIALQADMRHVRFMREMSGRMGQKAVTTLWMVLLGAGLTTILQHFGVPTWLIQRIVGVE